MSKGKVVALIQARIGSKRFHGKVLKLLMGKPMLWHIVRRVRAAKQVDRVVVIIPEAASDDPLAEFLEKNNIDHFRGSNLDVLDRYYRAATFLNAETIVRITADDPLKDPEIVDRAVDLFLKNQPTIDYASNCSYDGSIKATYPEGLEVEVLSYQCLKRIWENARKNSEREHVTPYIFSHSSDFNIEGFSSEVDKSNMRWTVDYPNDFEFIEHIYQELYPKKKLFVMQDVLDFLENVNGITELNSGIVRYEGYLRSIQNE